MYSFCRVLATMLFMWTHRICFRGCENIPNSGPVLLVSNHLSMFDPVVVGLATKRHPRFMAKQELFKHKLIGRYLTVMGGFPVDRDNMDRAALRKALHILADGEMLVLFPEGTRGDGRELLPFKNGAAYLPLQIPCTVVPMAIHNSGNLMKYCRPVVTVSIGKGMELKIEEGESRREALERFLALEQTRVEELFSPLRKLE